MSDTERVYCYLCWFEQGLRCTLIDEIVGPLDTCGSGISNAPMNEEREAGQR